MKSLHLLLLAPLVLGATLLAEPASTAAPVESLGPITRVLDVDGDGVLSAAEIAQAPLWLTTLDVNDDGGVSYEEYQVESSGPSPVAYQPSPEFEVLYALDSNHDGILQPLEIAQADVNLRALDVSGDGVLTRDELQPRR